ncbi:MAG: class I SAM-dependent methyltransferase, partial [Verrucomicrobiae bacterium]|nr:class I SAM-dependent methyltransferase [Verrucomicrobiae bacterium]
FEVGDMCATPFPDGWADIVTGSYALRNAPVLTDALKEIHRILKPGGHAAFLDFSKSPAPWRTRLQLPLLKFWGGLCGVVFHGQPEHAYIAESLRQFPDRGQLREILDLEGFDVVNHRNCFGGMLAILLLRKRPDA